MKEYSLLVVGAAAFWAINGFLQAPQVQPPMIPPNIAWAADELAPDTDNDAVDREYEKIVLATIDILTEEVEKHPDEASLYRRRAYQEYCIGLFKEAIYDLDQSIKLDSFNRFAHALRGDCLFELDDPDKAIEAYTRAIKLSPQDDHSYFWRGQCYLAKQIIDLAKRDILLACELNPEHCPENQVDEDDDDDDLRQ